MSALERLLRRLDPALLHVVDNVQLPVWIPELAHRMGIPVVRSVSCAEDLCAHVAPVVPDAGPAGYCPAPLSPERCARCVRHSTDPAFAAYAPVGDADADEKRHGQVLELLRAKRVRAREQFEAVYDRIVFASASFRDYFTATLPLDRARVRLIPLGVELEPSARHVVARAPVPEHLRFVLASTANPGKGVDATVEAFTHPDVAGRDDWRLLLAGGGDRSLFDPLRADPRVADRGLYAHDELDELLAGSDVGLSTSYFETFHRVTREYLLAGLPVIGSSALGITDVVVDGENGVIFDHAERGSLRRAITGLLDDRARVEHLAHGAFTTRVRTVAEEVDELEGLYSELGVMRAQRSAPEQASGDCGENDIDAAPSKAAFSPCARAGSSQHADAAGIADELVRTLRPATVFGVGRTVGSLVKELADRGVEASGRAWPPDVLARLGPEARSRCAAEPPTSPIAGRYDLMVCMGTVERLSPADAALTLDHVAAASDRILLVPLAGRADGAADRTREAARWIRELADRGFVPVLGYDASYVSPESVHLERADGPAADDALRGAVKLVRARAELADARDALEDAGRKVRRVQAEGDAARSDRREVELRIAHVARELEVAREEAEVARSDRREVELRIAHVARELEVAREEAEVARRAAAAYEKTKLFRSTRRARGLYGRVRSAIMSDPSSDPMSTRCRRRTPDRRRQSMRSLMADRRDPHEGH